MPPGALSSPSLERNLAVVRLGLAVVLLGGELLAAPSSAAAVVVAAYALVAAGAVWLLPDDRDARPSVGANLHIVDLAVAVCLPVLSDLSLVHYFPLFVLVAAAYRWGVWQTVVSGLVAVGGIALDAQPSLRATFGRVPPPNHLMIVGGYTLVFAVLVGHLAQRETRARSESAALADLFGRMRLDAGPVPNLRAVLRELPVLFGATEALLAVHDTEADAIYLWRGRPGFGSARRPAFEEIQAALHHRYFFPVTQAIGACLLQANGPHDARMTAALDDHGRDVANAPAVFPLALFAAHQSSKVFCLPHLSMDGLRLRLFLLDPATERTESQLRLLQTLACRITPVLYNLFLDRRLHAVLLNNERARVARELHDGLVQALIGIEMRLDVARRMVDSAHSGASAEVEQVQHLLRTQVADARTLMQDLRCRDGERRRLPDVLSETTARFGSATGIRTRFSPGIHAVCLPARVCHELAHVVDEALINVRKHSGAQNVAVTLETTDDGVTLCVEDDGRGFGFAGRMTQTELDTFGVGPLVIKERVQAIGGRLAIDSRPGCGTRLEVMVPRYATD